jgi:hypothetical protein
VDGTFWATARCCSGLLWVGIPQWMGFSRPQLVVVSGLFGWGSLNGWDFLGHNLLLSQASFFSMEFWLSRSLSHELFYFFTMEFWLSRSLSHELFSFFTMELWLSRSLSHELFSFFTMEFSRYAIWGKTLFIYITKSIYIESASLKTLPLDLEPPLQGKEYSPSYSNATRKSKTNFCPEITYRHVIQIF